MNDISLYLNQLIIFKTLKIRIRGAEIGLYKSKLGKVTND